MARLCPKRGAAQLQWHMVLCMLENWEMSVFPGSLLCFKKTLEPFQRGQVPFYLLLLFALHGKEQVLFGSLFIHLVLVSLLGHHVSFGASWAIRI
jgi:hypothetical protein